MDWENWEVTVDEEGKTIIVPTDHPFNSLAEPRFNPLTHDPADDPELNRAKVARLI